MTVPSNALDLFPPRPYAEIRTLVRDGDVMLCQGHDPFSRLIQWSTGSPWSHVAIAFRIDTLDRVMVIEAVQNIGVRCVPLSEFCSRDSTGKSPYPGKILLARHVGLNAKDERHIKAMAKFAFDHLGSHFAPGEIVKIALRIMAARLMGARHTPKLLIADDEFICSEFVAKTFEAARMTIPWDGLGFIAPSDFADDAQMEAVAQLDVSRPPIPRDHRGRKAKG